MKLGNPFTVRVYVTPRGERWAVEQRNALQAFVDDLRFGLRVAVFNFLVTVFDWPSLPKA